MEKSTHHVNTSVMCHNVYAEGIEQSSPLLSTRPNRLIIMSAFNLSKHTVVRVFLPLRMTTASYRPSNNKSDTISKQWVVSRGRQGYLSLY